MYLRIVMPMVSISIIYHLRCTSMMQTTKGYVDGVVRKCHVGLIPILSRNVDKTGYSVTASSQQSSSYAAFKASRFGNTEWATGGETSNFWIKIRCLEALRV